VEEIRGWIVDEIGGDMVVGIFGQCGHKCLHMCHCITRARGRERREVFQLWERGQEGVGMLLE